MVSALSFKDIRMTTFSLTSQPAKLKMLAYVSNLPVREINPLIIKVGEDEIRSLDQNSISHAWYQQIANELRDDDVLGWKSYCKLNFGVPILRAENNEFRQAYDDVIKAMSYEQKLKIMRLLPVTSLMTKKQLSTYLETMQEEFRRRDVILEFPEDAAMNALVNEK